MLIVKFPSKSVDVPLVVPFTITVAPGNGVFESPSNTVPVIGPCEKAVTVIKNAANAKYIFFIFFEYLLVILTCCKSPIF